MRAALIFLSSLPLFCNQEPALNVNSRYTVESIELSARAESKLSGSVKTEIRKLIGEKFNQEMVDRVVQRIRRELRGYRVVQTIAKGSKPENIRVILDVMRSKRDGEVILPRLVYNSKENFSFGADAAWQSDGHRFSFGILSDNDQRIERYSGIRGGYRREAADGKFRGGFVVESWRSQWNSATLTALSNHPEVPGIYRTRLNVQPEMSLEVLRGVTVGAGVSVQRFQTQFPAARNENSHAVITSLRLGHGWEQSNSGRHLVEAGYALRAATRALGSDFAYARHAFDARYRYHIGNDTVMAAFVGGYLSGRAPLFDRFLLGNSVTLRGYNKYDVAPVGGSRMVHGSLDYRHSWARVVYDTGVIYDRSGEQKVRHSLAAGFTTGHRGDSLSLLIAFPLKEGRMEPIFILGMNF
ncbi:MAG TPA: BamA/TamA family outer membrane protein [Bryobacteraceae bacterium]|nr:BamA/TamA family outer membrane protein [Bryobacteraceae bacterium]